MRFALQSVSAQKLERQFYADTGRAPGSARLDFLSNWEKWTPEVLLSASSSVFAEEEKCLQMGSFTILTVIAEKEARRKFLLRQREKKELRKKEIELRKQEVEFRKQEVEFRKQEVARKLSPCQGRYYYEPNWNYPQQHHRYWFHQRQYVQ